MRYLITVLILLTLDTISLSQAYAVPVEQDFDGMTFVKIDTQSFIFGSAPDQANYQLPEHPKVVPFNHSFWMGKYEVTQAQWETVMGSNPSTFVSADGPVETITWQQAKDFVAALNQQAGANHYRLPTEAEWEYVAKAGQYTQWSFGDNIAILRVWICCSQPKSQSQLFMSAPGRYPQFLGHRDYCDSHRKCGSSY